MHIRPLAAMPVIALLAACAAQPTSQPAVSQPTESTARLPGHIVRTDGHGDIDLLNGGPANCNLVSTQQIAYALATTNAARAKQGMKPMQTNRQAQAAAENHACEMATRGTMTHKGQASAGPSARIKAAGYKPQVTAENIAAGRFDFDRAVTEWVSSPGHLANVLIPGVRDFGVAYAVGADGKTRFYAAVYAQPK